MAAESPLNLKMIAGVVAGVLLVSVVVLLAASTSVISEGELARRCAESVPTWENYPEDIKAQLGARHAADWKGRAVFAQVTRGTLLLKFEITEGPWMSRTCAAPVLVRDPTGVTQVARGVGSTSGGVRYELTLPSPPDASVPWVEIQYPHRMERLPLDAQGQWVYEAAAEFIEPVLSSSR